MGVAHGGGVQPQTAAASTDVQANRSRDEPSEKRYPHCIFVNGEVAVIARAK
jgi:hypothetical protein